MELSTHATSELKSEVTLVTQETETQEMVKRSAHGHLAQVTELKSPSPPRGPLWLPAQGSDNQKLKVPGSRNKTL